MTVGSGGEVEPAGTGVASMNTTSFNRSDIRNRCRVGFPVGRRRREDSILQSRVQDFVLRGLPGGRFQILGSLSQNTGLPVIDVGFFVIQGGHEHLGGRDDHVDHALCVDADIARIQTSQVDAGHDRAMRHQQESVAEEKPERALIWFRR